MTLQNYMMLLNSTDLHLKLFKLLVLKIILQSVFLTLQFWYYDLTYQKPSRQKSHSREANNKL